MTIKDCCTAKNSRGSRGDKQTYACTNCGTVNRSDEGSPPSACMKCECTKFIKK